MVALRGYRDGGTRTRACATREGQGEIQAEDRPRRRGMTVIGRCFDATKIGDVENIPRGFAQKNGTNQEVVLRRDFPYRATSTRSFTKITSMSAAKRMAENFAVWSEPADSGPTTQMAT